MGDEKGQRDGLSERPAFVCGGTALAGVGGGSDHPQHLARLKVQVLRLADVHAEGGAELVENGRRDIGKHRTQVTLNRAGMANMRDCQRITGFMGVVCIAASGTVSAQSFTGLGFLPPPRNYSTAAAVTNGGTVVVGSGGGGGYGYRPFRWTPLGGLQDIAGLASFDAQAFAISSSGEVVVGLADSSPTRAFRWTQATGMQFLTPIAANSDMDARGVSADGSVVVGFGRLATGSFRAFRWTAAGGTQNLGVISSWTQSYGFSVSADGTVIAGIAFSNAVPSLDRAFRWTVAAGFQDLGLPAGFRLAEGYGVSGDGAVVVGQMYDFDDGYAMRWTSSGGMQNLGSLLAGQGSVALGVNGDGAAVVGESHNSIAFLWTTELGMVDLNTYLPTLGINLSGWTLVRANGISPDGRAICGRGQHNGLNEAWVAVLPMTSYPNCDTSTIPPILNVADFTCFLNKFAAGDTYANCDASTTPPVLNVQDFTCFLDRFAAGCP